MSEEIDKIKLFLDDKEISSNRQKFRKNLIILLKYYVNEKKKKILVKDLKDKFEKEPWFLAGVLFQKEHEEFIKENVFKYKNINKQEFCIEFLIDIESAEKIVSDYEDIEELSEFKLSEPQKEDISKALKLLKITNNCKNKDSKVDNINFDGNIYPAKCVGQIAYAIANGIEDDYLHPYVYTTHDIRDKVYKRLSIEYKSQQKKNDSNKEYNEEEDMPENNKTQPLNQILYGPPGTGKTYNTINKALEIILEKKLDENYFKLSKQEKENKLVEESKKIYETNKEKIVLKKENDNRELLKQVFEYYKEQGQIEFVTFHQSYGYEEFVEGIKAKTITDDETKIKTITYDVDDGIFKRLCENANPIKSEKKSIYDFDEKVNIWKISLGDSQNSDDEYLYDYCVDNNKILLGFGNGLDFSDCRNREDIAKKLNNNEKYSYPPTATNTFKNKMKQGDIVLVSYGNRKLRAIAKITGEYQCLDDDNLKTYVQSRGVDWLLIPEEPFSYEKVLKKQFSQMTIYDIKSNVKMDALKNLLMQNNPSNEDIMQNYILIIDEINRGNISKIFGELITLIEPSKRIGADEAIKVKLPHSNKDFGVPLNLYIVGTMNTADRSIAPIDTALRRRFVFEEMAPNVDLLKDKKVKDGEQETGIELNKLLKAINTRIEYLYDRDHTIGHAYLIDVKDLVDLKFAFKNKIIPLLAEYFYEDWENIKLVLDDKKDKFIQVKEKGNHPALSNMNKNYNKKLYSVGDIDSLEAKDFINIYSKDKDEL